MVNALRPTALLHQPHRLKAARTMLQDMVVANIPIRNFSNRTTIGHETPNLGVNEGPFSKVKKAHITAMKVVKGPQPIAQVVWEHPESHQLRLTLPWKGIHVTRTDTDRESMIKQAERNRLLDNHGSRTDPGGAGIFVHKINGHERHDALHRSFHYNPPGQHHLEIASEHLVFPDPDAEATKGMGSHCAPYIPEKADKYLLAVYKIANENELIDHSQLSFLDKAALYGKAFISHLNS